MDPPRDPLYSRHRFPAEVIVWLYFLFPRLPFAPTPDITIR